MAAALFGDLTADGQRIVLLAAGDDHELNQIAVRLDAITPHWTSALDEHGRKTGAVSIPATWPAVVQIGFSFNGNGSGAWVPQPRLLNWIADETARRVLPPPPIGTIWPDHLTPRDYQLQGAAALAAARKFLLLDEAGTGKTITAILGLEAVRRAGHDIFPLVVIVPSWEVADSWDTHIRRWAPHWPEPVTHGGANRARVLGWKGRRYVLLTTYATARIDAPPDKPGTLVKIRANAVVCDEAHMLKNTKAQRTGAVGRITRHAGTVLELTGTAITRDTGDVYPLLEVLDPPSWPSKKRMTRRYLATRQGAAGGETIHGIRPEMEPEFFAAMNGQMLRRTRADVLPELPPRIWTVRRPEIPPEWRTAYDGMRDQMLAELPDGGELPVMSILAQLTRLSQLASSAADVEVTYEPDEQTGELVPRYRVTLKRPSWKAESLLQVIAERPGSPVIAFMVSRQLAMITGEYCTGAGLRTGYITGPGNGITRATRAQAVTDFQAGKLDVIICTSGAGGLGITLTRSDTTVNLQRPWPLDAATQSDDRNYRIGQLADKVQVIDVVAKDSIDEHVRRLLREKAGQFGQFVRDPDYVRQLLGGLK